MEARDISGIWDNIVAAAEYSRKNHQEQINSNITGSGGQFSIDPSQVRQVIASCRAALDRLAYIQRQAGGIPRGVSAPATDKVSGNAVKQIAQMAGGSDGGFTKAIVSYQKKIEDTIHGLEESMKRYGMAEDEAIQALKVDWKA